MARETFSNSCMLVVAMTLNGGIGFQGRLPWTLPMDLRVFSRLTTAVKGHKTLNAVIMGRRTYDSLPPAFKPLPHRINIVLSTTLPSSNFDLSKVSKESNGTVLVVRSFREALDVCGKLRGVLENVFVIGGRSLYTEALKHEAVAKIFMTRVVGDNIECDVDVPELVTLDDFDIISVSKTFSHAPWSFDFVEYQRKESPRKEAIENRAIQEDKLPSLADYLTTNDTLFNERMKVSLCVPTATLRQHEEFQYLDLIADILNSGESQDDRTGVGTYFKFGKMMRFDLKHSFPLLTTKAVFFRGVVEELLWFIQGNTNSNALAQKGIHIWDANGSREFLDSQGLFSREPGDLGPIYGFQWRHFGAHYTTMHDDYRGQGVDQLQNCIDLLKNSPNSRRIILTAWNPLALKEMALPPCHILAQFSVSKDKRLSCILYQRSCDIGLGVPFNIASYALLTCILAKVCNLERGEFVYALGNVHVYKNHIEQLKVQLCRVPKPFPTLVIDESLKDIDNIEADQFKIVGYSPGPRIPMKMAV